MAANRSNTYMETVNQIQSDPRWKYAFFPGGGAFNKIRSQQVELNQLFETYYHTYHAIPVAMRGNFVKSVLIPRLDHWYFYSKTERQFTERDPSELSAKIHQKLRDLKKMHRKNRPAKKQKPHNKPPQAAPEVPPPIPIPKCTAEPSTEKTLFTKLEYSGDDVETQWDDADDILNEPACVAVASKVQCQRVAIDLQGAEIVTLQAQLDASQAKTKGQELSLARFQLQSIEPLQRRVEELENQLALYKEQMSNDFLEFEDLEPFQMPWEL